MIELDNLLAKGNFRESDEWFEKLFETGDHLGTGTSREVRSVAKNKGLVVKKQLSEWPFSNMVEWIVWFSILKMGDDVMGNTPNSNLKDLFARCYGISMTGRYLLMERLAPLSTNRPIPIRDFPEWLNDKKPNAFGTANSGKIKVMDYGMINFYSVLNPMNHTG